MKLLNLYRSSLLLKVLFYLLFLVLSVSSFFRTVHTDLDFKVFHRAAHQLLIHDYHFYPSPSELKDTFVYKYSPFFPFLISPLGLFSENDARVVWALLNALAFGVAWFFAERFFIQKEISLGYGSRLITLLLLSDVVTVNAIQGNTNVILLMLMVISIFFSSQKFWLGGLFAALATAIKVTPGCLLAYFLLTKNRMAIFWTLFFLGIFLICLPAALYGPLTTWNLYQDWFSVLHDKNHFPFYKFTNQSVVSVLTRLGVGETARLIIYCVIQLWLCACLFVSYQRKENLSLASLCFLFSLTIPSIVWKEYHVALLIPYLWVNHRALQHHWSWGRLAIWLGRIVLVHLFVQAFVGQHWGSFMETYGSYLWGVPILAGLCAFPDPVSKKE